jgi:amicyanin
MKKGNFLALLFGLGLAITGCTIGNQSASTNQPAAATPAAEVKIAAVKVTESEGFGKIITNSEGRALYIFTKDFDGQSACIGDCLKNWPSFYASELNLGPDLNADDFSEIVRPEGGKQTTYKDWPLYYYGNDDAPGAIKGDGVNGVWFVVKPDYAVVVMQNNATNYLTDSRGRALYYFTKDSNLKSVCLDQCLDKWPVFFDDAFAAPSNLEKSDFSSFVRSDSADQVAYRGWPLYYFIDDAARGEMKGEGVNDAWFTIDPAKLAIATGSAAAALTATNSAAVLPGAETAGPSAVNASGADKKFYDIKIENFAFVPAELPVKRGATVTWTNKDSMDHTATAAGKFDSGLLKKDQAFTTTFDTAGTYDYICTVHPSMKGKIIVSE